MDRETRRFYHYSSSSDTTNPLHGEMSKPLPRLAEGNNEIRFDGRYAGENGAKIKLEVHAKGVPENLNQTH